jgi:hypothetical protein
MWLVEHLPLVAIDAIPIDVPQMLKRRRAELERTPIEHHCPTGIINAP